MRGDVGSVGYAFCADVRVAGVDCSVLDEQLNRGL